ncbi:hypothetical protein FUAX_23500 [Fulvitalea axinellae]|uniref:RagB/SusD domain-containing protein n=1 Tax=Fulvitalea axinellae TaxID=1182444 RepID=A0AAU9CPD9_9BACT|nr:hypothetical protein FUAX_23500 [Fulvitalea axinellae]
MKTNIRIFSLCLFALLGLGACSDYFDPDQSLGLDKGDHWNTHDKVRRSVIGAYAGLQNVVEELVILGDLRADLMDVTGNYDGDLLEISENNIGADNPYANPRHFFEIITNCNETLANMDKALDDPNFTEEIRDVYKAELISLRSWVYFQLSQTYKEVPYITDPLSGYDKGFEPEKLGFEAMVNHLITEMEWAYAQGRITWSEGDSNNYWKRVFINRKVLLAELHLWAGNNGRAANLLLEAINVDGEGEDNAHFKCEKSATGRDKWKEIWNSALAGASFSEQVTLVPFNRENDQSNEFARLFAALGVGDYLLKPSTRAIQYWENEGNNGDFYRGRESSYIQYGEQLPVVFKYFKNKEGALNPEEERKSDTPYCIYRAADIHLMYAEAMNRMGRHGEALSTINRKLNAVSRSSGIRGRVDLPSIDLLEYIGAEEPVDIDSLTVIENVLLDERAKELAFEGRRWNALMRFASRRGDASVLADRVAMKFDEEYLNLDGIKTRLGDMSTWKLEFNMRHLSGE